MKQTDELLCINNDALPPKVIPREYQEPIVSRSCTLLSYSRNFSKEATNG
jgi:hypothetical protein